MKISISSFCFLLLFAVCRQGISDSIFSLDLTPGAVIPLGEDKDIFTAGGCLDINGRLKFPLLSNIDINALLGLGCNHIPVKAGTSLSTISIVAGSGIAWNFIKRFSLCGYAKGGYFYSLIEEKRGAVMPFLSFGINFAFRLWPTVSLGVDASYRNLFDINKSLIIALSSAYHFPAGPYKGKRARPIKNLDLYGIEFERIFPVFFKYYDDHSMGGALLHNKGESAIEDIKISFFVEEYMANPVLCDALQELKPGEEKRVELYALFMNKILEISESRKVSAKITVECIMNGREYQNEYIETIRICSRNAITWDDNRKAAAFVTTKDPTVLRFSNNVAGAVKDKVSRAVNSSLLTAMAMHEALTLYGMNYVIDSSKKLSVDYLQFPKQSLEHKAGACDDLSILYSALLESVGVETAFITVPDHMYLAVSLNMLPSEAEKQFPLSEDLIHLNNKTWLPVEVTALEGGFLKAWDRGLRKWREHEPSGQARLYPIHESWEVYNPVDFSGEAEAIILPDENQLVSLFLNEVDKLTEREISPKVAKLHEEISRSKVNLKAMNRLGVLYARHGLYDKAEAEFRKILLIEEYLPALLNMANLLFLNYDYEKSMEYCERASGKTPEDPRALLCLARVHQALENYDSAELAYKKLKIIDPEQAERFACLELKGNGENADRAPEAGNASEASRAVIWEED